MTYENIEYADHIIESTGCCDNTEPREMPQSSMRVGIHEGPKQANNFLGVPINNK